jgi:hypothetical protein
MSKTLSDEAIKEQVAAFEEQLRQQMGATKDEVEHFKRPIERPFTAEERDRTTVLFGGLTVTHDYVLKAATEGLGYRVQDLPVPDNMSLAVGKEFGNRGQCNPTYYTVGNLVKYLQTLREAPADRAASACMKRSIARHSATPASTSSAC